MTTFTRLTLEARSRRNMQALGNPAQMHRVLRRAWGEGMHPLWRVDDLHGEKVLYVLADRDLAGELELDGPLVCRDLDPALGRVGSGQRLAFRLRANPTRSVSQPRGEGGEKPRGKERPISDAAGQTRWLLDRMARLGLDPEGVMVTGRGDDNFPRGGRESARVPLTWAVFDWRATVTDPVALRSAVMGGVGSGRAYGCGLLTISRP